MYVENNITVNNQIIIFSLNETITSETASVLESFSVNGNEVIPWKTPVLYQKKVDALFTFDDLMTAVKSHQKVKLVNYYWWCGLNSSTTEDFIHSKISPSQVDAVGSQTIDTWEYFGSYGPQPYLAFSQTTFIDHPKYG